MKKINLLKRILPCLLAVVCVFTLASCKKEKSNLPYPTVSPTINKPNDAYMTMGDYKVTNQAIYNHLVQSYGLDELNRWIDGIILGNDASKYDSHYNDEEFKTNLDQIIYGVDEDDNTKANIPTDPVEKQEKYDEFAKQMRSIGLKTEAEWTEYYKHEYVKMSFAVKAFKEFVKEYNENEDNKEDYFTEEQYKTYYEGLHRSSIKAIVVTFDSENEAKALMKSLGVKLENLNSAWQIEGGKTVKQVFEEMSLAVNGTSEVKEYKYSELTDISSTIASRVVALSDYAKEENKSYTHGPQSYGSRFYLALKIEEISDGAKPFDELNDSERDEIFHALVEQSMTNDFITKALNEEKNKLGLKIYDQGLETRYVAEYDAAYKALSITDYDKFNVTYEESDKVVAEFTYNDKKYQLTAQELFEKLTSKYGAIISLLLLQQYVVLSNSKFNTVYNYTTGEVLNQTKYDEFYKSDITKYKEAFEKGNYEESGYPANYGWENFLKDYLGVQDEKELMFNLDGSLFSFAKTLLSRSLWVENKEVTDEDGTVKTVEDDSKVQAKMKELIDAYFSANIIGAMAYYDKNLDGVADEFAEETDSAAEALVNKVYEVAADLVEKNRNINKTLEEALQEVAVSYKLATTEHSVWGTYKAKQLRLAIVTSTSYTNSSSINETVKAQIKTLWNKINDYNELKNADEKVIGTKITGQSLDPGYHYVKNDEGFFVSCLDFTSDVFFYSQSDKEESNPTTAYKLSVIKATAPSYTNSTEKAVNITLLEYDEYLEKGTSSKSSAITSFYVPAINELLKVNNTSNGKTLNEILNLALAEAKKTTWASGSMPEGLEQLINDSIIVEKSE